MCIIIILCIIYVIVTIMEWLPIATPLFHHQLYYMGQFYVQNFTSLHSIDHKLRTVWFMLNFCNPIIELVKL